MRSATWIVLVLVANLAFADEPKPGYLGIVVEDSKPPQAAGAVIQRVTFESGGEAAGLLKGDVILTVDGTQVASASKFLELRAKQKQLPGTICKLRISRGGVERDVNVEIPKLGPERFLIEKDPPRTSGGTMISPNGGTKGEGSIKNGGNDILYVKAGEGLSTRVGDYEQEESGLHSVNLTGFPQHAISHFTGDVKLAGILHVSFKEYTPLAGDAIEIFADAKSLSGKFDLLLLPAAPKGSKWEVVYDDLKNKIDFDGDGKLDVTLVARPMKD